MVSIRHDQPSLPPYPTSSWGLKNVNRQEFNCVYPASKQRGVNMGHGQHLHQLLWCLRGCCCCCCGTCPECLDQTESLVGVELNYVLLNGTRLNGVSTAGDCTLAAGIGGPVPMKWQSKVLSVREMETKPDQPARKFSFSRCAELVEVNCCPWRVEEETPPLQVLISWSITKHFVSSSVGACLSTAASDIFLQNISFTYK